MLPTEKHCDGGRVFTWQCYRNSWLKQSMNIAPFGYHLERYRSDRTLGWQGCGASGDEENFSDINAIEYSLTVYQKCVRTLSNRRKFKATESPSMLAASSWKTQESTKSLSFRNHETLFFLIYLFVSHQESVVFIYDRLCFLWSVQCLSVCGQGQPHV